ncbi:methyltransferase [Streptomyces clavifer]|nr:methyltransferase [Streptomyces clavifer]
MPLQCPTVTAFDFLQSTRASYDAIADEYATRFRGELAAKPLDRALLVAFVELVRDNGGGPLADVGCGTGRVTGFLHGLGADVFGIDLSPGMLAAARRDHPELRFEEGSMLALDLPDGGLGGLLAWYSTIHVPDGQLPGVFAEFFRVLAPGGHLLLGFQAGDGVLRRTEGFGHDIDLDFRRRDPEWVAGRLTGAGLTVSARVVREIDDTGEFPETTRQAFLLARKPVVSGGRQDGDTD